MRIIVRSASNNDARAVQEFLGAAEFEAAALPGPAAYATALPEGEDVVVVPALDGDLARAGAYFEDLPSDSQRLCALAAVPFETLLSTNLAFETPFDGVIAIDGPRKLLGAQIDAYVRKAVAVEERTRRFATAVALNVKLPGPSRPKPLKALYIGAPSTQFLALERAFAPAPGLVAAAFTSFCGFDYLHDEAFDAVVLNGAKDPATAIGLCAALRRNAQLYHMPTMVLTAPDDAATRDAAVERGASVAVAANAPFEAPLGWLFEAIRRERIRKAAERDNFALRDLMGDPRTGLFRKKMFEAHVQRLAIEHHASGRPFSIAILRATARAGINQISEEAWRRGFGEVCSLAGRLIRDTDCATAIAEDAIAIALPSTAVIGARKSAERIASVAECTAFSAGDATDQPLAFERSAAELQPGESGEALLARVERELLEERATA